MAGKRSEAEAPWTNRNIRAISERLLVAAMRQAGYPVPPATRLVSYPPAMADPIVTWEEPPLAEALAAAGFAPFPEEQLPW